MIAHYGGDSYVRTGVIDPANRPYLPCPLWQRAAQLCCVWKAATELAARPFAPGTHAGGKLPSFGIATAMRELGARPGANGCQRSWTGWSRRPIYAGGERTESVLRELATRPAEWDSSTSTGEPDYTAVADYRRAAAARFADLSAVTDDPAAGPVTVPLPNQPNAAPGPGAAAAASHAAAGASP
eukprot:gene16282-11092_t